ncbi:MAG: hypothetical protein RLZZ511_4340 [Cyanobacteriota bacterium]|jgi:hypothetical protein
MRSEYEQKVAYLTVLHLTTEVEVMNNGSSLVPTVAGIAATSGAASAMTAAGHGLGLASLSGAGGTITAIAVSPAVVMVAAPLAAVAGVAALWYLYKNQ